MELFVGQKNLSVLETYLKDIIFSHDEILTKVEEREHIFEIKDSVESLGYISLYDLKAYIFEHEEEAGNYSIRNIESNDWSYIYEHPYFQRRKPHLVSADTLNSVDEETIYILHKGQKAGPFNKSEISEKLEDKHILLTDLVSLNAGHTWIKLYQVEGFDRRNLKESEQLPGMPSMEIVGQNTEGPNVLPGETTDGMISLAYLGNLKRGKAYELFQTPSVPEDISDKMKGSNLFRILAFISIIGIIYLLINIKNQLSSPFSESPTTGEQAEMLTPVDTNEPNTIRNTRDVQINNSINDQSRRSKFESRSFKPVRPASARKSFMDTQSFKDSNGSTNEEDSTYYYDNSSPMELDPIRTQVSKENYDGNSPQKDVETTFTPEDQ
jgi:hypothetical protein